MIKNDIKSDVLDALHTSKDKTECMNKLKKLDKKGGTKWGDPGYMKADVFNALISCCLGVPSGFAAAGMLPGGIALLPIGILGLYLTGQVFHINATRYDKFHLLEHYANKITRKKKALELALKKEKDPNIKKDIEARIKEADKCLKAIDKERRKLLPPKAKRDSFGLDSLDDLDIDWEDDNDWLSIDDIEESAIRESIGINESASDFSDILTESKEDSLNPVFLVSSYTNTPMGKMIKAYTKDEYSHSCIALDSSLETMYSYNANNKLTSHGGISFESLSDYIKYNPNSIIKVSCVFVKDSQYNKLHWKLQDHIAHVDQSEYDYLDLINIIANKAKNTQDQYKMICSQFVDSLLKFINIDITGVPNNLVTPGVISRVNNPKVYLLYEGKASDYNYKKIDRKINNLLKNGYKVSISESSYKVIPICEAKEFPIGFDKEGDLIIKKKKNIDYKLEHAKSKKMYNIYKKNNNLPAMAYEADKLWYMNTLIQDDIEKEKDHEKKESLIQMRSKILNEFSLYMNYINRMVDDYNFEIHYENSPFSDASVKITGSTIKHIIQYAKLLI